MVGLLYSTLFDTPLEVNLKLTQDSGDILPDPTPYLQLVGSITYQTNIRPDIACIVNLVSQFMAPPRHLRSCQKHILLSAWHPQSWIIFSC